MWFGGGGGCVGGVGGGGVGVVGGDVVFVQSVTLRVLGTESESSYRLTGQRLLSAKGKYNDERIDLLL